MNRKKIDAAAVHQNHFARIAGPDPQARTKCAWCRALPNLGGETGRGRGNDPPALGPGRRAWLHVARGAVRLNGETLNAGDAAAITDLEQIAMRADIDAELLLFDLADLRLKDSPWAGVATLSLATGPINLLLLNSPWRAWPASNCGR